MTNEERETMMDIKKKAESGLSSISYGNDCIAQLWQIVKMCDAALSKSPRNCDVGTADEQTERFRKFCKMDYVSGDCPDDCPLYRKDYSTVHCPFAWMQMLYEAEEVAGDDQA